MQECRVGCSGWEYPHWRGLYYPEDLPRPAWFGFYSQSFDTVEVNNTFYRLPEPDTFERWAARAPQGFLFAIKASRYLTHRKRLNDPEEPIERLLGRAARLGSHLGPLLYQLPPRWRRDVGRLRTFIEALPTHFMHAIEFRDASWYHAEIYALLDRPHLTVCLHDMAGSELAEMGVGGFVYMRFHGTNYGGAYSDEALDRAAHWLSAENRAGRPVYAYFNNDIGGHAVRDALALRQRLLDSRTA